VTKSHRRTDVRLRERSARAVLSLHAAVRYQKPADRAARCRPSSPRFRPGKADILRTGEDGENAAQEGGGRLLLVPAEADTDRVVLGAVEGVEQRLLYFGGDIIKVYIIENLDQRYLYPLLEQFGEKSPRSGLNPRPSAP